MRVISSCVQLGLGARWLGLRWSAFWRTARGGKAFVYIGDRVGFQGVTIRGTDVNGVPGKHIQLYVR